MKKEAENADLRAEVQVLQVYQTTTHEAIQSLTDAVGRLESLMEQKQAQIEWLTATVCHLNENAAGLKTAEVKTRSWWGPCAKRVLMVCLGACLCAAGAALLR